MKSILCLLVAVFASGLVAASNSDAWLRCRQLSDAAARLACYDAVVLSSIQMVPEAIGSGDAARLHSRAFAQPDAAAHAPPVTPQYQAQEFGLSRRVMPNPELPALQSEIPGRFEGWVIRGRIRLTNGQLWEISDGSEAAYNLKNPKVKITRGVSDTYFMEIEGVSQTPRVRRIE